MTDEDKIVLRTMHDLACRQLGPLLSQSGRDGGAKIAVQLAAMENLVNRLTAAGVVPELPEVHDGNSVEHPRA